MIMLARVAAVACLGGFGAAAVWWLLTLFGGVPGLPGAGAIPPWAVGLAAAVLAGGGEALRCLSERRRRRLNLEVAEGLGLLFSDRVPEAEARLWQAFSLFRNDSPAASGRMTGSYKGRPIDVFDFRYTVTSSGGESGSTTTTYSQTVYRFPGAAQGGPGFLLRPRRRLLGLLGALVGEAEVDLSPPDGAGSDLEADFASFRKSYRITLPDETESPGGLRGQFHPYLVGWLAAHPGWAVESRGGDVIVWRPDAVATGVERLRRLDELAELLTLMESSALAMEWAGPSRVEVRAGDRVRSLSGFLGLWAGVMLGATAGGILGGLVLSRVLAQLPAGLPGFPTTVALFFGSSIALAALGGALGWRLGRRSGWGRRLASRLDPRRGAGGRDRGAVDG